MNNRATYKVGRAMDGLLSLLVALILITSFFPSTHASRVSDKIYTALQSDHYCFRRLNATHQMGCSSDLGGNTGVVWIVESQNDLDVILRTGYSPPYIAVLKRAYYTRKNLLKFKENLHRIAGVVLLVDQYDKSRSSAFSPEDRCPNRYSGLYTNDTKYGDCKMNLWQEESPISGLLYDDIPYPIFMINKTNSIEEIESCFFEHNVISRDNRQHSTYPLCSMQLDSFMLAASNTETCLNSHSLVDELLQSNSIRCINIDNQNQNIFSYYKPSWGPVKRVEDPNFDPEFNYYKPATVSKQSVVMLVTKLSSISMFTEASPGADSVITSIVTLLAVAEALGKVRNTSEVEKSSRNIAFAIMDSEPFDYTGASAMTNSMLTDSFPREYFMTKENVTKATNNINLESIDYIINLDQLASYPSSSGIYLHTDPKNDDISKKKRATRVLSDIAKNIKLKFEVADEQLPLPPVSVQEFIKSSILNKTDDRLMGMVLSNYDRTFMNLLYHSIYDDSGNIYQVSQYDIVDHLSNVSLLIAKSSYELAFGPEGLENVIIDKDLIRELLYCYLHNANCNLFTEVQRAGQDLPKVPVQTFRNPIQRSDDMNALITGNLLAYFLGDKLNLTEKQCQDEAKKYFTVYEYDYVNGKPEPIVDRDLGLCIRSQVKRIHVLNPAYNVTIDGIFVNPLYPAWTVSLDNIRNPVRIFMKSSPLQQWCLFLLGILVTLLSYFIIDHINKCLPHPSESRTSTST